MNEHVVLGTRRCYPSPMLVKRGDRPGQTAPFAGVWDHVFLVSWSCHSIRSRDSERDVDTFCPPMEILRCCIGIILRTKHQVCWVTSMRRICDDRGVPRACASMYVHLSKHWSRRRSGAASSCSPLLGQIARWLKPASAITAIHVGVDMTW